MVVRIGSRIGGAMLAASTVFSGFSHAGADVKAGVDAWSAGDYAAAVKEWKGPADSGDPDALFNMAQAYKLGRGVDQDLARAETYYAQAAAKGHLQAAHNYGLLLFQRGDRARAMPFIHAAAARGDPRAQYVLGLAHFNGDFAPKDWVRAYALVSLSQQAGLSQATAALAQMDEHIPLEQRQQSVLLASKLAQEAAANRASQVAALDLGARPAASDTPPAAAPSVPQHAPISGSATAGADYARPTAPVETAAQVPVGWKSVPLPSAPAAEPEPAAAAPAATPQSETKPAGAARGPWRVQLGAFGVAGNADRLWSKVKSRPELAGTSRKLVAAGGVTKLQVVGFASKADADAACGRLKSAGFACLSVRD